VEFSLFYPVAVARSGRLGTGLLGLDTGLYGSAIAELREQAICADEYGWTSLMLAEHHFEVEGYQVTPNPLMLNVYLAQHTKRLRHGQMGLVLPNWNPLRLAEDIAMADHLTGGRLDIGLSRGYQTRSVGTLAQHYHVGAAGTGRDAAEARNREVFECSCSARVVGGAVDAYLRQGRVESPVRDAHGLVMAVWQAGRVSRVRRRAVARDQL
jgi:hypothetical protein